MAQNKKISDNPAGIYISNINYLQIGISNTLTISNVHDMPHDGPSYEYQWNEEEEQESDFEDDDLINCDVNLHTDINRSIAKEVSYRWYDLALELEIPKEELEELEKHDPSVDELAFQVLELWKSKHEDATVDMLVKILKEQEYSKRAVLNGLKNYNQSNTAVNTISPLQSLDSGSAEN